ncbi:MAG: CotH kinase family protein [Prevotella sp.]|nr:CotH kinase family protein [Prevotella sp.]
MRFGSLCLLLVLAVLPVAAQQRAHIYMSQLGGQWNFPVAADSIVDITVDDDLRTLQFNVTGDMTVPFAIGQIDSLKIEDEPLTETKDPYQVFQLFVTTADGRDITSRDYYTDCHVSLNGQGSFSNLSLNGQIRGRGNSSFLWYDKKPYRLKLNEKHKMLGLDKAKSWVLLANYRDVTDLMNTFVFEMGHYVGLPYTNHTRYVELFVNGDYRGLYQLTEQVQQNSNRVAVSKDRGILISLDVDDGPAESPYAQDNFWSEVYRMPVCVKYPDDERFTPNTVDSVRAVLAELEQAIKAKDYQQVEQLLDIPSFIKYLQIQEFIYNVELSAPRSIFMHKDGDGPWVMGPLWDFDAGYDFDWGDMYTGHNFFANATETVMGTNPLKRNGNYNYVPQFFTDLFGCKEFVEAYKAQWKAVKDDILTHCWAECMKYVEQMRQSGAVDREFSRWPLRGKTFDGELEKMHTWLKNRLTHISYLIAAIPEPDDTPVTEGKLCGTVNTSVTMDWNRGYDQDSKVRVSRQRVCSLMGLSESELQEANLSIVPLNTDGSEGENHTNGVFGGWFDEDGNPGYFNDGHVYIEVFQDLWNWNCGLYQWNCWDDAHTVTMQYQYPHDGTLLKVNVKVSFTITGNDWGW